MERKNQEIIIKNDTSWVDIQHVFSTYYAFLKIECMEGGKVRDKAKFTIINQNINLKRSEDAGVCEIDINNYRTVAELLQEFAIKLGIIVQVYRKSGKVWNLISVTNNWTLERQNSAGEFISLEMGIPGD